MVNSNVFSLVLDMTANVQQVPVEGYTSAISEYFPLILRKPAIETSILSKERQDILPVNLNSNQNISGNYVEFRIPSTPGAFIDLSQIWFDGKIKVTKGAAKASIAEAESYFLANGLSNTLFKSVNVYFNDKLVESNPFYAYTSYIRMLKSFSRDGVDQNGAMGGLFNLDNLRKKYTIAQMKEFSAAHRKMLNTVNDSGKRLYFPLLLDVNTVDQYLIDNVSIRIRLELNSVNWLVTANETASAVQYNLDLTEARLWVNKITPQPNALTAFNKTFNRDINYMFDKFLHKTYILHADQTSITCEQPFLNVIPERLYMVIVDMDAYSGSLLLNPLYFEHSNLNSFNVTVNGSTIINPAVSFPNDYETIYGELLRCIGFGRNHMLTFNEFDQGYTIFCIDFKPEHIDGLLTYEKSGNLRISMSFASAPGRTQLIMLLGDTNGTINITPELNITTDTRG